MRRCLLIVLVGFAASAWGTPAQAFTGLNSTPILGPATVARGAASPYPSEITVSGEIGSFAGASVTLHGVTTTAAADLDVMLVSPSGERILLASDPGGSGSLSNATLTFADN